MKTVQNIRFNLDNSENAAHAVFSNEVYNFYGLPNEKFVVIDIGLNIGLTSLYLANKEDVKIIYSFEPFAETFRQAEENLKLNPELAKKISIFNLGLSNKNESVSVHYNPEMPGSMSTVGDKFPDAEQEVTVELKKASEVLLPIIEKHTESIMLKMDCEGAEHRIIPELATSGVLEKVKVIVMEWHFRSPELLIRILRNSGFMVFCNQEMAAFQGIIRAVKCN